MEEVGKGEILEGLHHVRSEFDSKDNEWGANERF